MGVEEAVVPPAYSTVTARGSLRLLDCFAAYNTRGELCSLEVLEQGAASPTSLRVEGVLLEHDEDFDPQGACEDVSQALAPCACTRL